MDPERGVSELEEDFRSTAEDIIADAAQLKSIEKEKASLGPNDPRVVELAKAADDLGEKIAAKTSIELALAEDAAGAG